jgi:hypothetical protein
MYIDIYLYSVKLGGYPLISNPFTSLVKSVQGPGQQGKQGTKGTNLLHFQEGQQALQVLTQEVFLLAS